MQAAAMGQLLVLYECVAPAGSHSLHQSLSHTQSRSPLYLSLPRALSLSGLGRRSLSLLAFAHLTSRGL